VLQAHLQERSLCKTELARLRSVKNALQKSYRLLQSCLYIGAPSPRNIRLLTIKYSLEQTVRYRRLGACGLSAIVACIMLTLTASIMLQPTVVDTSARNRAQ